jgi:predicted dehydrogenase
MSLPTAPIRFAIVGLGHIGKRHAYMVQQHPEAELVAVIDPINPQFDPSIPYFERLDDYFLNGPTADVLTLATPNGLHVAQAQQALAHGLHVVVEKPIGLRSREVELLLQQAQTAGKQLFPVMQNRYSPPSQWIKGVMQAGLLGEIYLVQLHCFWNRDQRYYLPKGWHGSAQLDGGTLFTQFSHFIDIMYWLFGDIQNIQGKFADFNHKDYTDFEDSGFVSFDFINGGMGSLNYSTSVANQNLESSMTIIGQNGSVKIGGQYMNEVEVCNITGYEMPELAPTNPGNDYGPYKGSAANHNYVISNVIDTLNGRTAPTTNALEGMKVVDIIERIYAVRDAQFSN